MWFSNSLCSTTTKWSSSMLLLIFLAACSSPEENYGNATKLYREGNYAEAAEYYAKAAEQGNVDAMYELGLMLLKGELISPDSAQAQKLLENAHQQHHLNASYQLGMAHINEQFPEHNVETGLQILQQAAAKGQEQALQFLVRQTAFGIAEHILTANGIDYHDLQLVDFGDSRYIPELIIIQVQGIFRGDRPFNATIQYMEERPFGTDGLLLEAAGYSYCNGTIITGQQSIRNCDKSVQMSF